MAAVSRRVQRGSGEWVGAAIVSLLVGVSGCASLAHRTALDQDLELGVSRDLW
jgi:hypothetical protein